MTKGYGIRNRRNESVTEDTVFSIASNSKLFASLSIGILAEDESLPLKWTTKVSSILPEWKLQDPVASEQTNLIDILSHRTGLPRHDFSYGFPGQKPAETVSTLRYLRPSAEFRDVNQYNNLMYLTGGLIVERISSTPFIQFVQKHIFDPLDLTSTTYDAAAAEKSGNLAEGYVFLGQDDIDTPKRGWFNQSIRPVPYFNTPDHYEFNAGAGGVLTTAKDAAVWLQTLLLEGRDPRDNRTIIPSSAIHMVVDGHSIWKPHGTYPEFSPQVYGMGQWRYSYQGHEIVEHTGSVPGFTSIISRFPHDNLGIAILTNSDGGFVREIIKWRLAEDILGLKHVDWNARTKLSWKESQPPSPTPRNPNARLPKLPLSALAGTYVHPTYGSLNLTLDSEKNTSLTTAYQSIWIDRINLVHFEDQTFNLTLIAHVPPSSIYEDEDEKGGFNYTVADPSLVAEFDISSGGVVRGLGISGGFWGAGDGVPSPEGETVRERAEVWFDRV